VAFSIHRDHHVRHNPVCIAFLHWSQAVPAQAGAAAALRAGWEFHLRGIPRLRRDKPASPERVVRRPTGRSVRSNPRRSSPPSLSGWRRIGLLALRHDDYHPAGASIPSCARPSVRGSCPPLSRRRSPNDPSDHSISAPVLRLPGRRESYQNRFGQVFNTVANITCAHTLARRRGQATGWRFPAVGAVQSKLTFQVSDPGTLRCDYRPQLSILCL
jgi:hypothetical protein